MYIDQLCAISGQSPLLYKLAGFFKSNRLVDFTVNLYFIFMSSLSSLFFAGAYDSCIKSIPPHAHTHETLESDKRSYLIRSLALVGKIGEARSLLKPPGVLDEALLLWIEGFPLKSNPNDFQKWSAILMKADLVRAKLEGATQEEGVHEAAVLLSHVYCWAGNQEIAYALCAVIPTLEA